MKRRISVRMPDGTIEIELDGADSPETVRQIVGALPFTVQMSVWGDEIYSKEHKFVETFRTPKT